MPSLATLPEIGSAWRQISGDPATERPQECEGAVEDAARPAAQNPSGAAVDHNRDLSTFGVGRWLNWKSSTFSTSFGDPETSENPVFVAEPFTRRRDPDRPVEEA